MIRAGLVQDLGDRLGARLVHPRIAYLTASDVQDPSTPYARAYRVREVLPHTVKVLKSWVKQNRIGTLEIKKRGTDVTPEQLRRQPAVRAESRHADRHAAVGQRRPGPHRRAPCGPGRRAAGLRPHHRLRSALMRSRSAASVHRPVADRPQR